MKIVGIMVCVAGLCVVSALAQAPAETQPDAGVRVGVYDSRAIAIAFVGSPAYKATRGKKATEMRAAYDTAKAEGDKNRVAELEAWGNSQQALLHKQAFSTAPVDDMLEHIKDQLPGIAKASGVGPIVSKWDKETLAEYKTAELADITMALVDAFQPTERQRKSATDVQKRAPIPLKEAAAIDD